MNDPREEDATGGAADHEAAEREAPEREAIARYHRIHEILGQARDLHGAALDRHLTTHCGDDSSLRAEVLKLLAAGRDENYGCEASGGDAFAETNLQRVRSSLEHLVDGATSSWLPEKIGTYKIVRQIGQGGMGIVYEATQESPRRSVAIKLLHPIHATAERLRRFEREAELLGRLQHPGITNIFEAGSYDVGRGPQPFFAMELVHGMDIRTHCERYGLSREARIELLAHVADALQYAHDHGVVHRDLKPDNVLVDERGQPRILDFGIARATDQTTALSTLLTEKGKLVGTLAYMAPEQLSQSSDATTLQVDVYALGVLGFELLTGRAPRSVEDLPVAKAIEVLARTDAPRASLFDPTLKGDVETILGKALEHDRERRYPSAAAFAGDLRRYLANRPIEARPPSHTYLVRKFARRHRVLVASVVVIVLVAVTGTIVSTNYAIAASRRANDLERASYLSGIAAASSAVEQQDYASAAIHLDRLPTAHRGWEYDYLRARLVHHVDEWEAPPATLVCAPVFDAEGSRMFASMDDGSLRTWETSSGRLLRASTIAEVQVPVVMHGPTLRYATWIPGVGVVIGGLTDGRRTHTLPGTTEGSWGVTAWDHDGRRLLYSGEGTRIWDGERSRMLTEKAFGVGAFDRSGNRIAIAEKGGVVLLEVATGKRIADREFKDHIVGLEFAPDDAMLAVAGHYRNVYLLRADTLAVEARLAGHTEFVTGVSWTRDGSRLVSSSGDGTMRIWSRRRLGSSTVGVTGMRTRAYPAVAPDGEQVVIAGERVRRFPLRDPHVLRGHESYVYHCSFSPDASILASCGYHEPNVHVWDVNRARLLRRLPVPRSAGAGAANAEISEDGLRLVALGAWDVLNWDIRTGATLPVSTQSNVIERFLETLGRVVSGPAGGGIVREDGRRVALCRADGIVEIFDYPTARPATWPPRREGVTWNEHARSQLQPNDQPATPDLRLRGHVGRVYCASFSPDGSRIATGGNDGTVRIWDAQTGEQLLVLRGHEQYVHHVAFSPDGKMLASASGDFTIRLWDALPLPERRARGVK